MRWAYLALLPAACLSCANGGGTGTAPTLTGRTPSGQPADIPSAQEGGRPARFSFHWGNTTIEQTCGRLSFTVAASDGNVLARRISEAELAERFPKEHASVRPLIEILALALSKISADGAAAQVPKDAPLVIGHLEGRRGWITMTCGPAGIRYTLRSPDGSVLAAELDEAELARKYPDVFDTVRFGIADGAVIWVGQ